MKPYKYVQIYFYPTSEGLNEDLWFYMVEPGEEYFLHMSLWKNVPLAFTMDGKTESMDITLSKQMEKSSDSCVDDLKYDYVGK